MMVDRGSLQPEVELSWMRKAARRHWWAPLLAIAGSIQIAVSLRALLQPFPPPLDIDAALFQHAGWYIGQGAIPYIHIWDPTPPLSFFIPAFLSALTADNVLALHIVSVFLTGFAAVCISLLIGSMVVLLTDDRLAALLAGLVLYTFAQFYLHAARGFGFKHLALFCGFLALWLALTERPLVSGTLGAASMFIWLPGAIFALLALGISVQRQLPSIILRYFAGFALATFLIMLPIIYWDAVQPMITMMASSFLVSETQSLAFRFKRAAYFLNVSGIFLIPAAAMFVRVLYERRLKLWWVLAGTAFFAGQILFLDFDNFPDLFPLVAFGALLVGLFIAETSPGTTKLLAILVLGSLLLSPVVYVGLNRIEEHPPVSKRRIVGGEEVPTVQTLYWEKIKPESCHYRFSTTEQQWLLLMESKGVDTSCEGLGT